MFNYLVIGGLILIMFMLGDIHHQLKRIADNTSEVGGVTSGKKETGRK